MHHVFVGLHVALLAYVWEMWANMDDFLPEMVNLNDKGKSKINQNFRQSHIKVVIISRNLPI